MSFDSPGVLPSFRFFSLRALWLSALVSHSLSLPFSQSLDIGNESNQLMTTRDKRSSSALPMNSLKVVKALEILEKVDEETRKADEDLKAQVKSPSLASTQVTKALSRRNRSATLAQI